MTCIIQLKQRCDGFTLMRTDESGGVTSHLHCENQECSKILRTSLCPHVSPLFSVFLNPLYVEQQKKTLYQMCWERTIYYFSRFSIWLTMCFRSILWRLQNTTWLLKSQKRINSSSKHTLFELWDHLCVIGSFCCLLNHRNILSVLIFLSY